MTDGGGGQPVSRAWNQGLRVVDASVFPRIPGFFIVTPIYTIAEKASDVILADAPKWAPTPGSYSGVGRRPEPSGNKTDGRNMVSTQPIAPIANRERCRSRWMSRNRTRRPARSPFVLGVSWAFPKTLAETSVYAFSYHPFALCMNSAISSRTGTTLSSPSESRLNTTRSTPRSA